MKIFKKSCLTVTQICKIRQIKFKKQIELRLMSSTEQNELIFIHFFNKKNLLDCKQSFKIDQRLIQKSFYKVKIDLNLVKKLNLSNLNKKKQLSKLSEAKLSQFFFQTTTISELFRSKILFKKISFFVEGNYWKNQFLMNFLNNCNNPLKSIDCSIIPILPIINLNYKINKINLMRSISLINNILVKKVIYYIFFIFCKFFYPMRSIIPIQKNKLFLLYKKKKHLNKYKKILINGNYKKFQISLFFEKRFMNKKIACNLIIKKFKWKTLVTRPILNLNRFDIKKLCQFWNLPLYPDKTNNKLKFRRNRIRKQLLPFLRFFFNRQIDQTLYQFSELTLTEKYYLDYLIIRLINNYSNNNKKLKNSLNFSFSFDKSNFLNKQFQNSFFYFIPFGLRKRIFRKMLII